MKKILLTLLLLIPTWAYSGVYGINTLNQSLKTICVVGDHNVYDFIKLHWGDHPDVDYILLHDHPSSPAQPDIHYYWVHQQVTSCGAILAWITNDATTTQIMETFQVVMQAYNSGKHPVLVGMVADHPLRDTWSKHFKQVAPNDSFFNDLSTMFGGGYQYIVGNVGVRTTLIK